MCARYGAESEYHLLKKHYKLNQLSIDLSGVKSVIYPHSLAPVIVQNGETPEIRLMNYSLIPHWSKVRKPKFTTYNARIEDIEVKPTWRVPFLKRHCLVPMRFFIESCHMGDYVGNMIRISSNGLMTAAGVYDEWLNPETGELIESFAIITTSPPPDILKAGHDRSPLFLSEVSQNEWLKNPKYPKRFLLENLLHHSFRFEIESKLKSFASKER